MLFSTCTVNIQPETHNRCKMECHLFCGPVGVTSVSRLLKSAAYCDVTSLGARILQNIRNNSPNNTES